MELLVVRHAIAEEVEDAAAAGRSDAARRLTARGRRRMECVTRGLLALELHCDVALHSPWTRAGQTAALLAPIVRGSTSPCASLCRAPDAGLLADVLRAAEACRSETGFARAGGGPCIALVGHQPWLGECVAWLTCGERAAGSGVQFGKGSVAWLTGVLEPAGMELQALLPARVLRRLGAGRGRR